MVTIVVGRESAPSGWKDVGRMLYLLLLGAVVFLFWEAKIFAPLKLLVVFFHEASHAGVAWLTGGQVREMVLNTREGGHVLAAGGNRFLTLNAGYLGSLLWGLAIYRVAATTRLDRYAMGAFAVAVAALSLLFASGLFANVFGVGAALAMFLAARYLSHEVNDFLLRLIGLTSMIYVPRDIFSDTIARASQLSDARMLAQEYGGATVLWGGGWLAVSAALILFCLIEKGDRFIFLAEK